MQYLRTATLMLALMLAPPLSAHSLKDVESQFGAREKYFQAIDKEAPAFTLQDADGTTVRLADFRGKVVVLHFIYASCSDACPLHAERIAEIQAMINLTPMKEQVQFVTVTTAPNTDRGDVLRSYGAAHGLVSVNWVFLTTAPDQPEDTTRKLAERFGHKFIKTADGDQMHGVVTHVINRDGRWRGNFHSLRFEPTNLVVFINALVNDRHHGTETPRPRGLWGRVRELF